MEMRWEKTWLITISLGPRNVENYLSIFLDTKLIEIKLKSYFFFERYRVKSETWTPNIVATRRCFTIKLILPLLDINFFLVIIMTIII